VLSNLTDPLAIWSFKRALVVSRFVID
jgi:hypothetical protein